MPSYDVINILNCGSFGYYLENIDISLDHIKQYILTATY